MFKTVLFQEIDDYLGVSALYLAAYFKKNEVILRMEGDIEALLDRTSTLNERDLVELCKFYAKSL